MKEEKFEWEIPVTHSSWLKTSFWEKCFSAKYFDLAQALPWFPSACIPESPPHFLSSGKSCGVPQYSGFVNPVAGDQEPQMCLAPCCMTILPEEFDEEEEWSIPLGRVFIYRYYYQCCIQLPYRYYFTLWSVITAPNLIGNNCFVNLNVM